MIVLFSSVCTWTGQKQLNVTQSWEQKPCVKQKIRRECVDTDIVWLGSDSQMGSCCKVSEWILDCLHLCDLIWWNGEQVARQMFLILPVQYMTNKLHVLWQNINYKHIITNKAHTQLSMCVREWFLLYSSSKVYWNGIPQLLISTRWGTYRCDMFPSSPEQVTYVGDWFNIYLREWKSYIPLI